jgi:hypothetical protein
VIGVLQGSSLFFGDLRQVEKPAAFSFCAPGNISKSRPYYAGIKVVGVNLLCAIANLLNSGGPLQQIVHLLNQILALL